MGAKPQETADLVIFTEEILDGKNHFLCSGVWTFNSRPVSRGHSKFIALQLYWNHTSAWVLSCNFAAYFHNIFFWEHFWTADSKATQSEAVKNVGLQRIFFCNVTWILRKVIKLGKTADLTSSQL